MMAALRGVKVLDLSRLLPGPFLTQILADLGAEVVKLEPPGLGDETRWIPPWVPFASADSTAHTASGTPASSIPPDVDGVGYAFAAVNRGKRSIVVDLKSKDGVDVAMRLAARSDVLIESFRPGVLDRLGLSDAALAAANPRLVRCALVGYAVGEYRDDVGHDLNYQSLAGALVMPTGAAMPPTQVADLGGALYGATGILAALLERERTGKGQRIEVALADAALAFQALPLARSRAGEPDAPGWELTGRVPCYRLYECADGRHVALACLEEKFWVRFCNATGVAETLQFDRAPEAHAALDRLFATRPAGGWVDALRKVGVPITPVLRAEEVTAPASPSTPLQSLVSRGRGPQDTTGSTPLQGLVSRGRGPQATTGSTPLAPPSRAAAPALGEHTDEILREAGYAAEEVARLRAAGVVEGATRG